MSRLRLTLAVLIYCLIAILLGGIVGAVLGIRGIGFVLGLLLGIAYTSFGAWASEKFVLSSWDARLLERSFAPNLYEILQELCDRTETPLPTLYAIPREEPNALVIAGRDGESTIAVTHGLTKHLDMDEVQAVMALMVARLATGAMADWTIAAGLAGLPLHGALGKAAFLRAPSAALLQLSCLPPIIRAADHHAAHLSVSPAVLASALTKIATFSPQSERAGGNPATSLLFAVPPYPNFARSCPTVSERIAQWADVDK